VASGPAGGQVLTGVFPGTLRAGYLYLPPNFSRSVRYPVVYLLHGMPGSPSEYLDGTQLATQADQEIAAQRLRPFIAVIPAAIVAILYGASGTARLLVLSQVILSMQLIFAVVPLVRFTSDRAKMGALVNARWLSLLAEICRILPNSISSCATATTTWPPRSRRSRSRPTSGESKRCA